MLEDIWVLGEENLINIESTQSITKLYCGND
jgi:hypothetical protein